MMQGGEENGIRMKSLSIIHSPLRTRPDSAEYQQVKLEVIVSFRDELKEASWWKQLYIRYKIHTKVQHILRNRLYDRAKSDASLR